IEFPGQMDQNDPDFPNALVVTRDVCTGCSFDDELDVTITVGGEATPGIDHTLTTQTFHFPPGDPTIHPEVYIQTVPFHTLNDHDYGLESESIDFQIDYHSQMPNGDPGKNYLTEDACSNNACLIAEETPPTDFIAANPKEVLPGCPTCFEQGVANAQT